MRTRIEGVSEAYLHAVVQSCAELTQKAVRLQRTANEAWAQATQLVLSEAGLEGSVVAEPGEEGASFFVVQEGADESSVVE